MSSDILKIKQHEIDNLWLLVKEKDRIIEQKDRMIQNLMYPPVVVNETDPYTFDEIRKHPILRPRLAKKLGLVPRVKKKPYWIEVEPIPSERLWILYLCGNNGFYLHKAYRTKREANQMAKRIAKNLGLDIRK